MAQARHRIKVVSPFEQYAHARGHPDAPEVGQRHTHHQGTRTRNNQKHQGAVQPHGPPRASRQQWRHKRNQGCECNNHRRVHTCKAADKHLGVRLARSSVLHHRHDALQGTLGIRAQHPYPHHASNGNHAGRHLVSRINAARFGLASECCGVKVGPFSQQRTIERHTFAGHHFNHAAHLHGFGLHIGASAVMVNHNSCVGTQVDE